MPCAATPCVHLHPHVAWQALPMHVRLGLAGCACAFSVHHVWPCTTFMLILSLCRCACASAPPCSRACRASPQTTASTLPQPPALPSHPPRPARATAMETAGRLTTSHGCSGRPPPNGSTLSPPPRQWSVLLAVSHVARALVPVCCSCSGALWLLLLSSWTAPMVLCFYMCPLCGPYLLPAHHPPAGVP